MYLNISVENILVSILNTVSFSVLEASVGSTELKSVCKVFDIYSKFKKGAVGVQEKNAFWVNIPLIWTFLVNSVDGGVKEEGGWWSSVNHINIYHKHYFNSLRFFCYLYFCLVLQKCMPALFLLRELSAKYY